MDPEQNGQETKNPDVDSSSCGSGSKDCSGFETVLWWTVLVVAILAIPSAAAIVTAALPAGGIAQILIFVLACWGCTWTGMWLMRKSDERDMQHKK